METEIQNILDRNFTRVDNEKALKELLDLFDEKIKEAYTDGFSDSLYDFDYENYH